MIAFRLKLGFLVLVLFSITIAAARRSGNSREPKLFSLFNIVTFSNTFCTSNSVGTNGNRRGTCYTAAQCGGRGGMSQGSCAAGFGVCCVFFNTGTTVTENCTYLRNPGFPAALTGTTALTYTIQKCSNDVCSVRLDFESFTTVGPANTLEVNGGACTDTLTLTGSTGEVYPTICGQNTGQHVYVEMGANAGDTAVLNFAFTGTGTRTFEIKATQVECGAKNRPPEGCFQYYTGSQGTFRTFNFLDTNGNHLANQQYTACIRQQVGFCCVEYTVCSDPRSFTLNTQGAPATDETRGRIDDRCDEGDWLLMNGASNLCNGAHGGNRVASKLCGTQLTAVSSNDNRAKNNAVCDCFEPFELGVRTDTRDDQAMAASTQNLVQSRGICLNWRLLPCH